MATNAAIGIDVGSRAIKAIVLSNDGRTLGSAVVPTGVDLTRAVREGLEAAIAGAGLADSPEKPKIVATGFGRSSVPNADATRTELACHASGCHWLFPEPITVVDVGGQDSKVIRIDANGHRVLSRMNRKCAAGTGAFLEEVAFRLRIPLEELDKRAAATEEVAPIGSYCTVFAATEMLTRIRAGASLESIARGALASVVNRILEMDPLEGKVVLTGGVVAHFPALVEMLTKRIGGPVAIPPAPQLTGALGAALHARTLAGS